MADFKSDTIQSVEPFEERMEILGQGTGNGH